MLLVNCKIHLKLNWIKDCIFSIAGDSAKFKITDAKLHVPLITLATKDTENLTRSLSDGFKRSVFGNNYQAIPAKVINNETNIYEWLGVSFQGVETIFALAYDATDNDEAALKNKIKVFFSNCKN